jgi:hypothetical protein
MTALAALLRTKPVTILASLQAVLGIVVAFGIVDLDGSQVAAIQALFAALGLGGARQVTANTRLDDETLDAVAAARSPWSAPLTVEEPLIGEPDSEG